MESTSTEPFAVSIPEAARLIGCGRSTLYQLLKTKEIPLMKLGKRSLVPVAALRKFVEVKSTEVA